MIRNPKDYLPLQITAYNAEESTSHYLTNVAKFEDFSDTIHIVIEQIKQHPEWTSVAITHNFNKLTSIQVDLVKMAHFDTELTPQSILDELIHNTKYTIHTQYATLWNNPIEDSSVDDFRDKLITTTTITKQAAIMMHMLQLLQKNVAK